MQLVSFTFKEGRSLFWNSTEDWGVTGLVEGFSFEKVVCKKEEWEKETELRYFL